MSENFYLKNTICKIRTDKGFNVLEVILSITIIVVGILAITNLFFALSKSAAMNKNKIIAIYLAEENMEIVRQIRDTNWLNSSNWDQGISAGDSVAAVLDSTDITKGFQLVNRNANSEIVYEDTVGGGYFQNLPPGLLPPEWKPINFKRWLTVTKPDADTVEVVSHVYYNGKELISTAAILKDWKF